MNVIPFQFENHSVRVITDENGEPQFVGKDICDTLGYTNHNKAMNDHCKGVTKRYPLQTPGGIQQVRVLSEPDMLRLIVNSTLPAAQAFEKLVFEEILPTIRKTGSYHLKPAEVKTAAEALKLMPAAVRAARALGLDKNAAAISANQLVNKLTNVNLLAEFGHTHLVAENQEVLFFTPTELGKRVGTSGRVFNMLLAEAGLQTKQGDVWTPADTAEGFFRIYDTGKRHNSGTPVQQIKWAENVLSLVKIAA